MRLCASQDESTGFENGISAGALLENFGCEVRRFGSIPMYSTSRAAQPKGEAETAKSSMTTER